MGSSFAAAKSRTPAAALVLLEEALAILDEVRAPAQIGANIDLAICHLRAVLDGSRARRS